MTELEYIICEAERCGDINLETRNELLNVLYEADVDKVKIGSEIAMGASSTYGGYLHQKIRMDISMINAINKDIRELQNITYNKSINASYRKVVSDKIDSLRKKREDIETRIKKNKKKLAATAVVALGSGGVYVGNELKKMRNEEDKKRAEMFRRSREMERQRNERDIKRWVNKNKKWVDDFKKGNI